MPKTLVAAAVLFAALAFAPAALAQCPEGYGKSPPREVRDTWQSVADLAGTSWAVGTDTTLTFDWKDCKVGDTLVIRASGIWAPATTTELRHVRPSNRIKTQFDSSELYPKPDGFSLLSIHDRIRHRCTVAGKRIDCVVETDMAGGTDSTRTLGAHWRPQKSLSFRPVTRQFVREQYDRSEVMAPYGFFSQSWQPGRSSAFTRSRVYWTSDKKGAGPSGFAVAEDEGFYHWISFGRAGLERITSFRKLPGATVYPVSHSDGLPGASSEAVTGPLELLPNKGWLLQTRKGRMLFLINSRDHVLAMPARYDAKQGWVETGPRQRYLTQDRLFPGTGKWGALASLAGRLWRHPNGYYYFWFDGPDKIGVTQYGTTPPLNVTQCVIQAPPANGTATCTGDQRIEFSQITANGFVNQGRRYSSQDLRADDARLTAGGDWTYAAASWAEMTSRRIAAVNREEARLAELDRRDARDARRRRDAAFADSLRGGLAALPGGGAGPAAPQGIYTLPGVAPYYPPVAPSAGLPTADGIARETAKINAELAREEAAARRNVQDGYFLCASDVMVRAREWPYTRTLTRYLSWIGRIKVAPNTPRPRGYLHPQAVTPRLESQFERMVPLGAGSRINLICTYDHSFGGASQRLETLKDTVSRTGADKYGWEVVTWEPAL